jgi:hypothetical protein
MRRMMSVSLMAVALYVPSLRAQSPFSPEASEIHSTNDMSSNGAIAAVMSPVAGQPYEASKVTHSVWKLADGTTIRHDAETKIARDGEGRVREDLETTSASSIGGKQTNATRESVTVADPVDHSLTTWTGTTKMAFCMQMPNLSGLAKKPGMGGIMGGGVMGGVAPPPVPRSVRLGTTLETAPPSGHVAADKDEVHTEDLGQQSIAGVLATGKRTTTVIATGKIGNDQPITIVHEEWYSPDLKVVVKSEDSDPRSGERTMELEGLTRGDPDPSLFHAPEGYKVQDMAQMMKTLGSLGNTTSEKP